VFSRRPLVNSKEGRELSALLSAYSINTSQPSFTPATASVAKPQCEPSRANPANMNVAPTARPVGMVSETPLPKTAAASMASEPAANEVDDSLDDDMIVIEEDDFHEVSVPVRQAPLVRRQEYRQLFAKLRRG
jgi:hypothetical protein